MTNSMKLAPVAPAKTRKMRLQLLSGAIVGGVVTYAVLSLIGTARFDLDDPSRVVALATGLVFALMGLMVGFGVAAPRPGAHMLNVEDADELREQRGALGRSAAVMVLVGAAVMVLALARVGDAPGVFASAPAGLIAAACFALAVLLTVLGRNDHDELMRATSREAMTLAMLSLTAVLGVWAAAAQLGLVGWITPLGAISALLVVQLAAVFVVSAKRGMLRPR